MAIHVMLTVDLNRNVTTDQRNRFYEELRIRNWVKIDSLTTTWKAHFNENVRVEEAIEATKSTVAAAATTASISSYDAAAMFGGQTPTIVKKS